MFVVIFLFSLQFMYSFFFFFFMQTTAYEMRISDWSSDVCSSDLWENRQPWPPPSDRPIRNPKFADRKLGALGRPGCAGTVIFRKGYSMKLRVVIAAIAIALTAAACENSTLGGTKQTIGTLGGAAAGGLSGAQFGSG